MNKKEILKWEILGFLIIFFAGSFLHFAFALSGRFTPLAIIAAVNESTWEHLKLAFWPALFFALFEFGCLKMNKKTNNFWPAKAIGIALMPILIVIFFYSYRAFFADSLFMDIFIFGLAVFIGQMVSYAAMVYKKYPDIKRINALAIAVLILITLIFSLFTFNPSHWFLFKDPISGGYGIQV